MTQPRTLHELYQLLWEQIKDIEYILNLVDYVVEMYSDDLINTDEFRLLMGSIFSHTTFYREDFVLRMIEETKNN